MWGEEGLMLRGIFFVFMLRGDTIDCFNLFLVTLNSVRRHVIKMKGKKMHLVRQGSYFCYPFS